MQFVWFCALSRREFISVQIAWGKHDKYDKYTIIHPHEVYCILHNIFYLYTLKMFSLKTVPCVVVSKWNSCDLIWLNPHDNIRFH